MEPYIEKYMSLTPQKIAGIKVSYPKYARLSPGGTPYETDGNARQKFLM